MPDMTPEQWAEHDARVRAANAAEAAEKIAEQDRAVVAALAIPPRVLAIVQGAIRGTEATRALMGDVGIVCLSGNPGNGKTVAAASWLYAHRPGLFVKAPALARFERYDDAKMRSLLRQSVLVVDDLGVEFQDAKGNFMALLDELIDFRYDHDLPLVITTNLDATAFKLRYGERVADRIREVGRFVSIGADSLRGSGT